MDIIRVQIFSNSLEEHLKASYFSIIKVLQSEHKIDLPSVFGDVTG